MPTNIVPKTVAVTLKEDERTLGFTSLFFNEAGELELGPEDWVEWDFGGLPAELLQNTLPAIHFESELGPFQCLQSIPPSKVQGKGNVGSTTESGKRYRYTAWLLDNSESGVRAKSGETQEAQGVVVNLPQSQNTSPSVVVNVAGNDLELDPPNQPLMLYKGDTALWNVFHLPLGNFITFQFLPASEADPPDPLDPMVGPFKSILINRAVAGEETGVVRVIGVNFMPDDRASYSYRIAVRDSSGTILSFHDPTIDNLGQPPGT
ncbi:MAG TPA: hypothetical protein VLV54_21860 [Thermoanaerobaculia bacterium]|nr:hypothetical protein [Thermoanaerobaculia bacterium]